MFLFLIFVGFVKAEKKICILTSWNGSKCVHSNSNPFILEGLSISDIIECNNTQPSSGRKCYGITSTFYNDCGKYSCTPLERRVTYDSVVGNITTSRCERDYDYCCKDKDNYGNCGGSGCPEGQRKFYNYDETTCQLISSNCEPYSGCPISTPTNSPTEEPTMAPTILPTIITSITPTCECQADNNCYGSCVFERFSETGIITYANSIKCDRGPNIIGPTPQEEIKNNYCKRTLRLKGDVNGDGVINITDMMYYSSVVNGGGIPAIVNPDVNGDGTISQIDRFIIVEGLKK